MDVLMMRSNLNPQSQSGMQDEGGDWYSESGGTSSGSGPGALSSTQNPVAAAHGANPNSPTSVWNNNGQGGSTLYQRSSSLNNSNGGLYGASSNGAALYSDHGMQNYTQPLSVGGQGGGGSSGVVYGGYNNQGGAMYGGGNGGGGMNLAKDYGVAGAGGDMDNMNAKYGYKANYTTQDYDDYDNEPPLLEELGINLGFVWLKFLIVMFPNKDIQTLSHLSKLSFASFSKLIMKSGDKNDGGYAGLGSTSSSTQNVFPPDFDSDMAGPIIAFLVLASLMLLAGKVNFGYIYGFSVCGCALLHAVLELMYVPLDVDSSGPARGDGTSSLSVWETASTLGYSIIPVIFLAFINVFIPCNGTFGLLLSAGACGWCTYAATRLFDNRMKLFKNNQFVLVAYPVVLFYAVFCLITIF